MPNERVILGIDPGLAIAGYGVVAYAAGRFRVLAYGAIETPAHTPVPARLLRIGRELDALLEAHHPSEMAIEELFFGANHTTGIAVAQARGVILEHAAIAGLTIAEYKPAEVKQAVVGYGNAEKRQVIRMVRQILGLGEDLRLDDTADALAIAICHAHTAGNPLYKLGAGK